MEYLKLFKNHSEYESFTATTEFALPNISHCIQEVEVHYNPSEPPLPCNVIKYTAAYELPYAREVAPGLYYGGIYPYAFNANIVSHTFENGVGTIEFSSNIMGSIGNYAFNGCSGMTSIQLPKCNSLNFSYYSFGSCNSLKSIEIPMGCSYIGDNAFLGCAFTSVDIPDSVTSIGRYAFYGCSGLTSIFVRAETPTSMSDNDYVFEESDCPIYVPSHRVSVYKTATGWRKYADRIQAIQ